MEQNGSLPKRKSPRMKQYDYSTPGYYFVTVCTHQKTCIFGTKEQLNAFGRIAEDALKRLAVYEEGIRMDVSVVMPNHIHAIVVLENSSSSLDQIIGRYKAHVSREIHKYAPELTVWQKSFHDHVIRNQKQYEKIWNYVRYNRQKWEDDCFYTKEK